MFTPIKNAWKSTKNFVSETYQRPLVKAALSTAIMPGLTMLGRGAAALIVDSFHIKSPEERETYIDTLATLSSVSFVVVVYKLCAQYQLKPNEEETFNVLLAASQPYANAETPKNAIEQTSIGATLLKGALATASTTGLLLVNHEGIGQIAALTKSPKVNYAAFALDPLLLTTSIEGRFKFYQQVKSEAKSLLKAGAQAMRTCGYNEIDKTSSQRALISCRLDDVIRNIEKMTDSEASALLGLITHAAASGVNQELLLRELLKKRHSANYRILPSERSQAYKVFAPIVKLFGACVGAYGGAEVFYQLGAQSSSMVMSATYFVLSRFIKLDQKSFNEALPYMAIFFGAVNTIALSGVYAHKTAASFKRIFDVSLDYALDAANRISCQPKQVESSDSREDTWGSVFKNSIRNIGTWTFGGLATLPRLALLLQDSNTENNIFLIFCSLCSVMATESWGMNEAFRSSTRNQLLKLATLFKMHLPSLSDENINYLYNIVTETQKAAAEISYQSQLPIDEEAPLTHYMANR